MRPGTIINQAKIYKRHRSSQISVWFKSEIFTEKDAVNIIYHADGFEIKRASISSSKKSSRILIKKGEGVFNITLSRPYQEGVFDIENLDGDTIFVPCLMVE
jgi:hypothetical protein